MSARAVKLALFAAGLAFVLSAPAEAAKARKHKPHVAAKQTTSKHTAKPAMFRAAGSNAVYFQGNYLGSDPDPRIRFELNRDLGKFFGGDD